MAIFKRSKKDSSWRAKKLAMPLALEDGRMPGFASAFMKISCGLLIALVIWASIAQIQELAPAKGELRPTGSVQLVQHLEGGIVEAIVARAGMRVKAGETLIVLQPNMARADRDRLRSRAANFMLQKIRLDASLQGRDPDFGEIGMQYPELAREQLNMFESDRSEATSRRDGLKKEIDKIDAEIETLIHQIDSLELQLDIQKERLQIYRSLASEGLVSKSALLENQQRYEQTRFERVAKDGQLKIARDSLKSAKIKLREAEDTRRRELTEQRSQITAELAEVDQSLSKEDDRVHRLTVISPVDGIVQDLLPKAIGEVIKPGADIAHIVPANEPVVADVRINPRDIAHIRIGAPVKVKVTAFDAVKSADLDGEVRRVSASTFYTERGEPYYRAEVALLTDHVTIRGEAHMVQPGMQVQANIITGAKSVMTYLLKPVHAVVDSALSER